MLELLLPWDNQPQEAVPLDGTNPINDRVAFAWRSWRPEIPDVGLALTPTNAARAVSHDGVASRLTAGYWERTSYAPVVTSDGAGTGDFTAIVRANPASSSTVYPLVCQRDGTGSFPQFAIIANSAGGGSSSTGSLEYYTYNGTLIGGNIASKIDGRWHTWGIRRVGTVVSVWEDGVQIASVSGTLQDITGASSDYAIGKAPGTALVATADFSFQWSSNRGLSDREMADITGNPWVVYEPQAILVPVSVGGGSATNLTAADAAHAHTLDNVVLTSSTALVVQDMAHGHTLDNVTLSTTGATSLTVADSLHGHALDAVVLTSQAYLVAADMAHSQALDGVTLTLGGASLAAADLLHAHALDGAALTLDTYLAMDDAVHGHTLDGIVLTPVGTDAVGISLGGRPKSRPKRLRYQDYDVPLPPEVLTSTIPQDTPPTGIKPAPSLSASALRPASKLATRPAKAKAPKAQAPAPAPVATPEPQATPAVAIVPVVAAAAPVSAAAKPPRAMALADILSAQDLTHDELLQAVKLLARELQDGPALRLVRSHRIALRR